MESFIINIGVDLDAPGNDRIVEPEFAAAQTAPPGHDRIAEPEFAAAQTAPPGHNRIAELVIRLV